MLHHRPQAAEVSLQCSGICAADPKIKGLRRRPVKTLFRDVMIRGCVGMRFRCGLRICFESAIGSHTHYWEIAKDLMKACRLPSSVGFAARYPRAKPTPVSYPLVKGGPMNR